MQNIFANTRKVHILRWYMDLFSQALFGWDYFAKIEAKMFAKQAQNSLKCSRINFSQIWQTLQQILLLENLVLLLIYWQNIITWGECYSIQEVSRRILVVFLQSWMFLQSCEVFANFVQIILQRNFCCKIFFYRNLACFCIFSILFPHFPFL